MRIGLIIYGSLDTVSGGYLYDRKLVETLREKGDEVVIISLPWRHYPAHLMDNFSNGWKAQLREQCQGLDLLLQDELNHPSLFWLNRWLRREFPMPIISIVHHLRSSEGHSAAHLWLYRRIERAYLQRVDGFIFNSETTKASVEAMLGKTATGVVAFPAADHLERRLKKTAEVASLDAGCTAEVASPDAGCTAAPLDCADKLPLNILIVGNVSVRKGVHTVLDALAQLPPEAATLNIVGSLDEQHYLLRLHYQMVRLDLTERVQFSERVSDEELCEHYQASDFLAVPSYEGFGIVYLEAMHFGLPVIGSTAGAAHEIITHGKDGFLVDPQDSEQLARHLLDLYHDRGLLERMSQAASKRYKAHPTWDESMGRIHQWLQNRIRNAS